MSDRNKGDSVENREYWESERPSKLPERPTHCVCRKPVWERRYWGRWLDRRCGRFEA